MPIDRRVELNGTRILVLLVFGCFDAVTYLTQPRVAASSDSGEHAAPTPTPVRRAAAKPKYSEFPHNQKAHQLACNTCHKFPSDNWNKVRQGDNAFPDITD